MEATELAPATADAAAEVTAAAPEAIGAAEEAAQQLLLACGSMSVDCQNGFDMIQSQQLRSSFMSSPLSHFQV